MAVAWEKEVLGVLDEAMGLRGRAQAFDRATPLLGALPELDSMAVLTVITLLEDRFAITVHDDEMDGAVFATVGTLADFVTGKLGQAR
jgi:acyl carrier protein